jgi:integrase/recombinase XerD
MGPATVKAAGALDGALPQMWSDLLERGYTPLSAMRLLRLAAHLGRWLESAKLTPADVTERVIRRYIRARRAEHRSKNPRRGPASVLRCLRRLGVIPESQPASQAPHGLIERTLVDYQAQLSEMRGLAPKTIELYSEHVRAFVATRKTTRWGHLSATEIRKFVIDIARRCSVNYCKQTVTSLRSFLRFLQLRGLIKQDLASAVPRVAAWRLSSLPRTLTPADVDRLLSGCDRGTARGLRETAILLLLVRLGLRACEVSQIMLDDINWREGELVVHGKAGRTSRLPLSREVGDALAAYVKRARPTSRRRELLLHCRVPHDPLTRPSITAAATKAMQRVGIDAGGAHVLRHTAATQMLRSGATLLEIGQVLRHRAVNSTTLYAKVDDRSLGCVVQPWPRSVQR